MSQLTAELTLVSQVSGNNYSKLETLLAKNQWKEADQETYSTILKICEREKEGWLDDGDIKKCPRHDIHIINKLWVKYSDGKFGFSVQTDICKTKTDSKELAHKMGWLADIANSEWVKYEEYIFGLDAPQGHLPSTSRLVGLGSRNVSELPRRLKIFWSMRKSYNE
ncbi:MAG: GUN4 domain-containing protein [Nostoc sp. LLA-1]|nr:GUN4 domain-containing protein [Cyanocohniella sp. LLY]